MSRTNTNAIHIPFLSEDEKIFLNTTATYSQVRRTSHSIEQQSTSMARPSIEDNAHRQRRNQVVSVSSLALLWKRRDSSTSTCSSATAGSVEHSQNMTSQLVNEDDYYPHESCTKSPKARELESLIFEQPQRTVRLSLTPGCAV